MNLPVTNKFGCPFSFVRKIFFLYFVVTRCIRRSKITGDGWTDERTNAMDRRNGRRTDGQTDITTYEDA